MNNNYSALFAPFKPSDKVVCVTLGPEATSAEVKEVQSRMRRQGERLQIGRVYVVRKCVPGTDEVEGWGVSLVGHSLWLLPEIVEIGHDPSNFRLLSEVQAEARRRFGTPEPQPIRSRRVRKTAKGGAS